MYEKINLLTEEEQLECIKKNALAITLVLNKTEDFYIKAINLNLNAFMFIYNPTKKVKEIALSHIFDINLKNKICNECLTYYYKFGVKKHYNGQKYLIKYCNNMNIDYSIYCENYFNIFICFNNKEDYLLFKLGI